MKLYEKAHLAILGAGASKSVDKNMPLMNNLIETCGLQEDIRHYDINPTEIVNFEEFYSKIYNDDSYARLIEIINDKIFNYFSKLELTDKPNAYDYLFLSLTKKDVIATFNWDPFLWQAAKRNHQVFPNDNPILLFLHGNVKAGHCYKCRINGELGFLCSNCQKPMRKIPLLYPIGKKDYTENQYIKDAWNRLHLAIEKSFITTIYGYSAPKSDSEAMDVFLKLHNRKDHREFSVIEVIDIKPKKELDKSWKKFWTLPQRMRDVTYTLSEDCYFYPRQIEDSLIYHYPRNTTRALFETRMQQNPIELNSIPKFKVLAELQEWFKNRCKTNLK
jgi:hypothetical protein